MRRYLICCALLSTACSPASRVETVTVVPEVPADLRAPCVVEPRVYETLADVALILSDHVEGLDCANGRIVAIDVILTKAEKEAEQ